MKSILIIFLGLYLFVSPFNFVSSKGISDPPQSNMQTLDQGNIKDGDIIFQITESSQCKAVQLATHSQYSHCGIVFKDGNEWFVYEAVQPVQKTPLTDWISHGQKKHFVIKRIKNSEKVLTPTVVSGMKEAATKNLGKNYDVYFGWSDDKIYCSELVWKAYHDATGLEVGKLQKLKDFDLTSPAVKYQLKQRYGDNIPLEEMVISPAAIFDSELVYKVQ